MADNDEGESIGVVVGALFGLIVLVFGIALWKSGPPAAPVMAPAAAVVEAEIAPVGEPLDRVYFALGKSELPANSADAVTKTVAALGAKPEAIVLLSGFHDLSGDPAKNAELAKDRALAVKAALQAAGVAAERIKLRKPESTAGDGAPEEARRVEIRVQ